MAGGAEALEAQSHSRRVGEQVGHRGLHAVVASELLAQLGHFLPPSEESKQNSDRSYAKGLLSLLRSGVAAMLQHRMSPAALFSELAIALDMVVDSQLPPAHAERVALAYTHKRRRLLCEASLNKPLKQGDEASFEDAMAIFLRKDQLCTARS